MEEIEKSQRTNSAASQIHSGKTHCKSTIQASDLLGILELAVTRGHGAWIQTDQSAELAVLGYCECIVEGAKRCLHLHGAARISPDVISTGGNGNRTVWTEEGVNVFFPAGNISFSIRSEVAYGLIPMINFAPLPKNWRTARYSKSRISWKGYWPIKIPTATAPKRPAPGGIERAYCRPEMTGKVSSKLPLTCVTQKRS